MYFDGCKTVEELNEVRENLIGAIQLEYSKKVKELKVLTSSKELIRKAQSFTDNSMTFMPYPITRTRGNRNEIIFNMDGTVTI